MSTTHEEPSLPASPATESMSSAGESLSAVLDQLTEEGYEAQFRGEGGGLRAVHGGALYGPEELVIEQLARFEGVSDPDEMAIVFALRADDGVRGTWTTTYGPEGNADSESDLMRGLRVEGPLRVR
jgi:hypothetical protein